MPRRNVYDGISVPPEELKAAIERVDEFLLECPDDESRLPSKSSVVALVMSIIKLGRIAQKARLDVAAPALRRSLKLHLYDTHPSPSDMKRVRSEEDAPTYVAPAAGSAAEDDSSAIAEHAPPTISTAAFARALRVMLSAVSSHLPPTPAVLGEETASAKGACSRSFTKLECFAVLSAGFFCFFHRESADCFGEAGLPSINFDEMHAARVFADQNSVEVAKLRMFVDYFVTMSRRIAHEGPAVRDPASSVVFARVKAPSQKQIASQLRKVPLSPMVFHPLGESIDEQRTMLRADFANEVIGGASLSFGCVQEEIMFAICPEMNVARLFCTPMNPDEAILIFRGEQYSHVKPGTYAFSLAYGGPFDGRKAAATSAVSAIDAMDYRGRSSHAQYSSGCTIRELVKACAGFGFDASVLPDGLPLPSEVATGNWGCGAFRGDPELKLLQQWLACSVAGRTMHYFPFSDQRLAQRAPAIQRLLTAGDGAVPAKVLLDILLSSDMGKVSVFDLVEAALADADESGADGTGQAEDEEQEEE